MKAVLLFRKGLRLHDNLVLQHLISRGVSELIPLFVLDPLQISPEKAGVNRARFLLESLTDLDSQLQQTYSSHLVVLRGRLEDVLEPALKKWKINILAYEFDTEPFSLQCQRFVEKIGMRQNVETVAITGHTLFDMDELVDRAGGPSQCPRTYQGLCKLVEKLHPKPPIDAPTSIPKFPSSLFKENDFVLPSLGDLGYTESSTSPFRGGETTALQRLEDYFSDVGKTAHFEKPKTSPAAFERPSTTVLSPYFTIGCISARLFYARLMTVYNKAGACSKPPVSLLGQLYWREFFYLNGYTIPNFDRMRGNTICRQIPWDESNELLTAWKEARTGYPWIDAILTQLREWGWVHHLARHSVACFLTRGDLWQHWEAGAAHFEKLLLDWDWSLNSGNWQWLSASAFFHQYFRVYSPVAFGKQWDKEGKYIRYFIPVLRNMPVKYIYEPWKAPLDVQKRAGCIVGKDYPLPIVDHATASKENKSKMAAAYDSHRALLEREPRGVENVSSSKRIRTEV